MPSERQTLERVTVNLVSPAARALKLGVDLTGHSKTDFINRAIQAYAYLEDVRHGGGAILVRDPDGELMQLAFL